MFDIKISKKVDLSSDVILYPGDCLELLPQLSSGMVKLIVTSPPYNLGKPYEKRLDLKIYLDQQKRVIKECVRVLANNGSLCWEVGNYIDKGGEIVPLDILLYPIFKSFGLRLRNRIIWYFGHGLHCSKRFSGRYESILWFTKSNDYIFNLDAVRIPQKYPQKKYFKGPKKGQLSSNPLGKNPTDIWSIPNVKSNHPEKTIHPCQFPIELVERLVLAFTNPGDWVIDPFMGVGSSLIAALLHKRKTIGAEINNSYLKVTEERINQLLKGKLKIRPMGKPIYEPPNGKNLYISLLLEKELINLKQQYEKNI
jgi:adenine-specific DNA-methyltransferase